MVILPCCSRCRRDIEPARQPRGISRFQPCRLSGVVGGVGTNNARLDPTAGDWFRDRRSPGKRAGQGHLRRCGGFLNTSCGGIRNPYSFNVTDIFVFLGVGLLLVVRQRTD